MPSFEVFPVTVYGEHRDGAEAARQPQLQLQLQLRSERFVPA
jgi:hypothetical protein